VLLGVALRLLISHETLALATNSPTISLGRTNARASEHASAIADARTFAVDGRLAMPERSARRPWTLWGLPAAGLGAASLVHVAHGSPLEITVTLTAPCVTYTLAILSCFLTSRCLARPRDAAHDVSEQRIEVEVTSLAYVRIYTCYGHSAARPALPRAGHSTAIKPADKGRGGRCYPGSRAHAQEPYRRPRGTFPGLAAQGNSPVGHRRRHHPPDASELWPTASGTRGWRRLRSARDSSAT
jgi:hypothetical protein